MWDEDKHPRDNSGKFTDKQGSTGYSKEQLSKARNNLKIRIAEYKQSEKEKQISSELDNLLGKEYVGVKGQAAIDKLMQERQGHVKAAFHREDIGDIDLIWGSDSVGLQHIISRRKEQGINSTEFIKDLADVVNKGDFKRKNERGNFEIEYGRKIAVIAPEYHGNKITYLLTAYKTRKKKPPQ